MTAGESEGVPFHFILGRRGGCVAVLARNAVPIKEHSGGKNDDVDEAVPPGGC